MAEESINLNVSQSTADMSGARVQESSARDYPRHFWAALKNGHYRYALTGVSIGAPMGALIGVALCALPFVGWTAAPFIISAFAASGALMGVEGFGATGAAAASRASSLAEKHARLLDAESQGKDKLSALNDNLMDSGRGHHYEFPTGRDQGKFFSWKSGLTAGAMGAASGAVIGLGGLAEGIPLATTMAGHIAGLGILTHGLASIGVTALALPTVAAAVATVASTILAPALVFGLLGLTFGIERNVLKSLFNQTESYIQGKLGFEKGPDLGKAQSLEAGDSLTQHRLRRQNDIDSLEKSYNDKIFWGALGGRFKGFTGVVIGALVGTALGAGLALTGFGAITVLAPLFAAGGGLLAMKVFSESGTEAGAEATARAIDTEFERNRELRAKGITPPTPQEAKETWFNPGAGVVAGIVGAAVGAALAPAMGVPALGILGIHLAANAAPAIVTAFWLHAAEVSAIIGGVVGGSYGLGGKSLKALSAPLNTLYDKVSFKHEPAHVEIAVQHAVSAPEPACDSKITAEDMAKLNERQATISSKSFAQALSTQQLQVATAGAGQTL